MAFQQHADTKNTQVPDPETCDRANLLPVPFKYKRSKIKIKVTQAPCFSMLLYTYIEDDFSTIYS